MEGFTGFVTVRTTSSRLPRKCLLPFGEGNVLEHILRRARHYGIDPIVCTSVDPSDDAIETIATREGVRFFRGSLVNKLKRWADCAAEFGLEDFHTVDADDPFFDGDEMMQSLAFRRTGGWDMVKPTAWSSAGGASVGYSLTRDIVTRAAATTSDETDTEMMWFHLERLPDLKAVEFENTLPQTRMRLTLDYPEDYWLLESVRRMVGNLASRSDVIDLFSRNPDLHRVNWFRNEQWKANQESKRV